MGLKDTKILTSGDVDLPKIEIPKKKKIVLTHGEGQDFSKDVEIIEAGRDTEQVFDLEKRKFEPSKAMTSHEMHEGKYGPIKDALKPQRIENVVIDLEDIEIPEKIEVPDADEGAIEIPDAEDIAEKLKEQIPDVAEKHAHDPAFSDEEVEELERMEDETQDIEKNAAAEAQDIVEKPDNVEKEVEPEEVLGPKPKVDKPKKDVKETKTKRTTSRKSLTKKEPTEKKS